MERQFEAGREGEELEPHHEMIRSLLGGEVAHRMIEPPLKPSEVMLFEVGGWCYHLEINATGAHQRSVQVVELRRIRAAEQIGEAVA